MNVAKKQEKLEKRVKVVKVHSSVERHCPGTEHSRVHLPSLSSTLVLMSKWH